jgi:hypothetical protein
MVKARRHLEDWRREHGGRGVRIPGKLWAEAVGVARTDGLFKTAKALRLEHSRLKVRARVVEGREGASDPGPETAFVEVGFESLGSSRTVMEFVGRDGDRMRIDVTSSSPVDVVGLSRAFWGRQL